MPLSGYSVEIMIEKVYLEEALDHPRSQYN